MRIRYYLASTCLVTALVSVFTSSWAQNTLDINKTSLDLQALQSRTFDATEEIAFSSVLSAFQDLGYIVESASRETGYITAKSPQVQKRPKTFQIGYMHTYSTQATASVETYGAGKVRIRLNFLNRHDTNHRTTGATLKTNETVLQDPVIFQNIFTKVQEGIFLRMSSMSN